MRLGSGTYGPGVKRKRASARRVARKCRTRRSAPHTLAARISTMPQEWQSYDLAADAYRRVAAPNIFAPVAKDLVARMGLASAEAILDVGTGTGVAARAALDCSRPGAVIVGLDPSFEMLRTARNDGLVSVVAGAAPGLPFSGGSFDAITANFVLSHLGDYRVALLDMLRVLRPAGRLGFTAWAVLEDEHRQLWQSIADSFAGKQTLEAATKQVLPWEEWFTRAAHLREALKGAGFINVEMHEMRYTSRISITDFLTMRETSIAARFMQENLGGQLWKEFIDTVSAEFHRRFADAIQDTRHVHIAIGAKP